MRRFWAAAVFVAFALSASTAGAEPRGYWGGDFRASAALPVAGSYNYLGADAFVGRRLVKWLEVEGVYASDFGNGAYGYPAACAQMCCGSQLRSWQMQQLGARVVFVPLHLSFFDISAGLGVAGILAHESRVPSHSVPASALCGGAFDGFHGAFAGSTFVSFELRPTRHAGLRASAVIGIADIEDFPTFQLAIGPVLWF